MLFSEPAFLFIFLPALLAAYFLPGMGPLRNLLLLLVSLFFYAWGEKIFVLMMIASCAFNWATGLWVASQRKAGRSGNAALFFSIAGNLGMLGVYKYADLTVGTLNSLLGLAGVDPLPLPRIELPIGISFFTFQAMSYVIDVYRGEVAVQKNPLHIALYVSLFPQLIAGPIVRYVDVANEITKRGVTPELFAEGVRRFIIGLGKKMILANHAAFVADSIFGSPGNASMPGVPLGEITPALAWLAVTCYALQIYFDFSGYSDMAIGLGKMFGFNFLENFNYPYISQSITEFWRRWHISLSTWFRDYLYIPLGGNRGSPAKTYRNLVIVFFLCGLWHGASWTFVVWGLYHGLFLVIERLGLGDLLKKTPRPLRHVYTLLAVLIGWVLFRAETLPQAWAFITAMFGVSQGAGVLYRAGMYVDAQVWLVMAIGALASTPVWPWVAAWQQRATEKAAKPVLLEAVGYVSRLAVLAVILGVSALLAAAGSYSPFIYFRF